ncbi:MAG: hypothetical protein FJX46_12425 [Alphaproteobacteria bacterium]|nr:hypothetical protein [Alphaproteobacteria bacterium]
MTTGYLAPEGLEEALARELEGRIAGRHGRLFLCADPPAADIAWAANVWRAVEDLPIASIGDAARKLRDRGRNWALYSLAHHRRAALIQAKLPKVSFKPLAFPAPPPEAPLGSWTLLAPDRMLCAARCDSAFPHGEARFVEDKAGPPNRAYLKLWEAFTRLGQRPGASERCLDLGASPGGWSWVAASLGARVVAVDKASLDPRIAAMPGVEMLRASAFSLDPAGFGAVDWLLSDVVCYPTRLLALVKRWLAAGKVGRFLCTLKFQGATDFEAIAGFRAIPGGRLFHLHANKHELTWFLDTRRNLPAPLERNTRA